MGGWHSPDIRVPPRWLAHQELSFAVTLHSTKRERDHTDQDDLFSFLWPDATPPTGEDLTAYCAALEAMPPSVHELLCSLEGRQVDCWDEHQAIWNAVRARLEWDPTLHRSRWAGAKLVADRLADGLFAPSQIRRLFRTELRTERDLLEGFDEGLGALAAGFATARTGYDRLEAISAFSEQGPPLLWALVENIILQQSLSWPLLVTAENVACALPALVTVQLGDETFPETPPDELVSVLDGENTHGQEWKPSLEKARIAAIEQWETKHASQDRAFQESVRNARVILDLRLASQVVEKACAGTKVRLWGPSLESYVALEVLSQLLGCRGLGSTCATGEICGRHENGTSRYVEPNGAFHGVAAVAGVEEKIECARRAFFFDRIIFPAAEVASGSRGHLRLVAVEGQIGKHNFGKSDCGFSGYATEALGQRWRRHCYIRCPDVAATFKEQSWRSSPSEEVAGLLRLFARTEQPVVRPSGYGPVAAAHALYWVNRKAETNRNPLFAKYAGSERVGRFAFVRAVSGEADERFWEVIWDVCGGTRSSFRRFILATSLREAAEELAALLNHVAPTNDQRVAAPDALVIFGTKHLVQDGPRPSKADPFARSRLDFLVDELRAGKLLRPCDNEVLRTHLGFTRLILIAEDVEPGEEALDRLDPHLGEALSRLSVFRHGFTQPMAKILLGLDDEECDHVLDALAWRDGRRWLLGFAENTQECYLYARASLPADPEQRAHLHLRAANAIVGILDRTRQVAHHDFGSALRPPWLHEAQWHAEQAYQLRRLADARERLSRIGEPFTWSQLRWAARYSVHAGEDMWRAALAAMDEMGRSAVHPIQLVWLAKFARTLELQNAVSSLRWAGERTRLLDEALAACAPLQGREAMAAEFAVRTTRAAISMDDCPDQVGYAAAAEDVSQGWALYDALHEDGPGAIEIIDGHWFEQCGDGEEQVDVSIDYYRRGFLNRRVRGAHLMSIHPLVKWLGCMSLIGENLSRSDWQNLGSYLTPRDLTRVRASRGAVTGLSRASHVAERWKLGRAMLLDKVRF